MQPNTSPPLKQSTQLAVLFPKKGRVTSIGRKFYVSLLRDTQQQLMARSRAGESMLVHEYFKAPLIELVRAISKPTSNLLESTKKYVVEMQTTNVVWSAADATKEGKIWDSCPLIGHAFITLESGKLWLHWQLPGKVVEVLQDPELYMLTQPEDLRDLDTYTAVALFIVCSRYADNPSHKTSIKPTDWWIDALRGESKEVRPVWRKFKSAKVMPAIEEINQKTNLKIEIREIKQGLAVKEVQFLVHRKSKLIAQEGQGDLHKRAAALGIPASDITHALASGFDETALHALITKMAVRSSDLPDIQNPTAFFRSEVRRLGGAGATKEESTSQAGQGAQPEPPPTATPAMRVFQELLAQPPQDIAAILDVVKVNLAAKNLLTPAINKRLIEGNWKTGILQHHAIQEFATKKYGPNWAQVIAEEVGRISV